MTNKLGTQRATGEALNCPSDPLEVHPATANCRRLLERGEHALLGVSPFNTQFNKPYMIRLCSWAGANFDRFTIVLPGEREAALMLEAAGTPTGKAARKTRHELNRNTRLINAALEAAQVVRHSDTLIRVSDFADNPAYRGMVQAAEATYRDNPIFRATCREMAALAVRGRQRVTTTEEDTLTIEQIELATKYVFAEIPFFINTPALLNVPSSVLAYHRPWPIGHLLFSGTLPICVDDRQGYLVLKTRQEGDSGQEDAA